jgi:hypothetical protein
MTSQFLSQRRWQSGDKHSINAGSAEENRASPRIAGLGQTTERKTRELGKETLLEKFREPFLSLSKLP